MTQYVNVSARVAPDQRDALEQLAVAADRSLSQELRRAIREHLMLHVAAEHNAQPVRTGTQ
jgi:predicted transcriptional regulator